MDLWIYYIERELLFVLVIVSFYLFNQIQLTINYYYNSVQFQCWSLLQFCTIPLWIIIKILYNSKIFIMYSAVMATCVHQKLSLFLQIFLVWGVLSI